ncbi:hypothetical protein BJY01DRAFT_197453 [Aspergillus pseudoustus]|uniref:Uncharacterized protein n=1 Tax=Aspergillus pseudoustus TaxID=1810923 RepID=A0ABR4JTP7_9EURO
MVQSGTGSSVFARTSREQRLLGRYCRTRVKQKISVLQHSRYIFSVDDREWSVWTLGFGPRCDHMSLLTALTFLFLADHLPDSVATLIRGSFAKKRPMMEIAANTDLNCARDDCSCGAPLLQQEFPRVIEVFIFKYSKSNSALGGYRIVEKMETSTDVVHSF